MGYRHTASRTSTTCTRCPRMRSDGVWFSFPLHGCPRHAGSCSRLLVANAAIPVAAPDQLISWAENLVHYLSACRNHRPKFSAVHNLGGPGRSVADHPGDLLGADSAMAHQTDERGPQFTRCPAISDPRRLANALEHLPDVSRVAGDAEMGCEHQPGVLPLFPCQESFVGLAFVECMKRLYRHLRKAECAA